MASWGGSEATFLAKDESYGAVGTKSWWGELGKTEENFLEK